MSDEPKENPPESAEPQFICPHCGAEPFVPSSMEFKVNLPNGGILVMIVAACAKCRKALSGQQVVIQPRVSPAVMIPGKKLIL